MRSLFDAIVCALLILSTVPVRAGESDQLDIDSIPRLAPGLAEGTVAWATLDQLHPTQFQTGKREVSRKLGKFRKKLKDGGQSFSKDFFAEMIDQMAPVYVAKTPAGDQRKGEHSVLAYLTDRHHAADALAGLYTELYGAEALSEPFVDKKGRLLNVILVKVMADKASLSEAEFQKFMIAGNHVLLERWQRGSGGETIIKPMIFSDLPEVVTDLSDNPYRALIGDLQKKKVIEKLPFDYSQFYLAKELLKSGVVRWDEVSFSASEADYEAALEKAKVFFDANKDEIYERLRREHIKSTPLSQCQNVFKIS